MSVAAAGLDLHEGIWDPTPPYADPVGHGCGRWPERLRLRSSNGELVRGRCRSTNLCAYCAKLAAVENSELLALDALAGDAPQLWAVLTTRSTSRDPADFYASRKACMKALRRRWPSCEYAALVEFTTGYGRLSGGGRRPHWNLLLKGIPAADLDLARDVLVRVWCAREDALPAGQYVATVKDAGGVMAYVALHFQKESQAPPAGWRGHRFLHSRGYLAGSTPQGREEARRSLRFKRELWRAIRRGLDAHDADLAAHEAVAIADATTWVLMQPSLEVLKSIDTEVTPCPDATPTPADASPAGSATARRATTAAPAREPNVAAAAPSTPSTATASVTDCASSATERASLPAALVDSASTPPRPSSRCEDAALPPAPSPTEQPASARPGRQPRRAPAPDRCPRPDDSRRPPPSMPDRGRLTADAPSELDR